LNTLQWDKEFALEQTAGDGELLDELVALFQESFATDLERLKRATADNDPAAMAAAAHSIKGSAASLGIEGIRSLALAVEKAGLEGSVKGAQEKIRGLEELLPAVHHL